MTEVIATMAVLAVIGSVVSSLVLTASKSYTDASRVAQYQAELSTAMTRVTRELRWIGIDPPECAPVVPLISSVSASSITWNTNYSLALVSGELRYTAAGGTAIALLKDVTAFTLQTYDDSNAGPGSDAQRRSVLPGPPDPDHDDDHAERCEPDAPQQGVPALTDGGLVSRRIDHMSMHRRGAASVAIVAALVVAGLVVVGLVLTSANEGDMVAVRPTRSARSTPRTRGSTWRSAR
jgi:hypothetical protein